MARVGAMHHASRNGGKTLSLAHQAIESTRSANVVFKRLLLPAPTCFRPAPGRNMADAFEAGTRCIQRSDCAWQGLTSPGEEFFPEAGNAECKAFFMNDGYFRLDARA